MSEVFRGFSEVLFRVFFRGFQRFLEVFRDSLRDPLRGRFPSQRPSVLLPLIVLPLELSPTLVLIRQEKGTQTQNFGSGYLSDGVGVFRVKGWGPKAL